MYILYRKEDNYVMGKANELEQIELLFERAVLMPNEITYDEIDVEEIEGKDLQQYKFIDGELIKLTHQEKIEKEKKLNPMYRVEELEKRVDELEKAIESLTKQTPK